MLKAKNVFSSFSTNDIGKAKEFYGKHGRAGAA